VTGRAFTRKAFSSSTARPGRTCARSCRRALGTARWANILSMCLMLLTQLTWSMVSESADQLVKHERRRDQLASQQEERLLLLFVYVDDLYVALKRTCAHSCLKRPSFQGGLDQTRFLIPAFRTGSKNYFGTIFPFGALMWVITSPENLYTQCLGRRSELQGKLTPLSQPINSRLNFSGLRGYE
jgi:hypothetical protein